MFIIDYVYITEHPQGSTWDIVFHREWYVWSCDVTTGLLKNRGPGLITVGQIDKETERISITGEKTKHNFPMFKKTPNNSRNDLEYVRSFKRDFPSWSPTVALLPPPPGIIGQFLLLGHDAGGIDWHEEKVRLRRVLRATGAVQQKLVHEDLRGKRWGDW